MTKFNTIKPIVDKNSYVTDTKINHRSDVCEIGDTKQQDQCYPQAKLIQWDNETNFSIRLKEDVEGSTNELKDGIFIWKSKDEKKEAHLYEIDIDEDGGLEFEVILHEKPSSNVIEYTLQTKGLNFFYQRELTKEEIDKGKSQPENTIGSYAIYHKTGRHNWVDKQYRTGKAFHIYRPFAIDSQDSTTWCELNIVDDLLTITVPQSFIDNAVYPIKIDPTFGYTSTGSKTSSVYGDNASYTIGTPLNKGSVTKITYYGYTSFGTKNIKAVIWNYDSPYAVITNGVGGTAAVSSTQQWVDLTYSTEPTVNASDDYYVGIVNETTTISCKYDDGISYDGDASDSGNDYSSPGAVSPNVLADELISVYATYDIIYPKLYYRKGGSTTEITLYTSEEPGWHDSLRVRADGATYYAQLDSNTSHTNASDLRVRQSGTTYAVLTEDSTPS